MSSVGDPGPSEVSKSATIEDRQLVEYLVPCSARIAALMNRFVGLVLAVDPGELTPPPPMGEPALEMRFASAFHDTKAEYAPLYGVLQAFNPVAQTALTEEGFSELPMLQEAFDEMRGFLNELFELSGFLQGPYGERSLRTRRGRTVILVDVARRLAWTLRRLADRTGLRTKVVVAPGVPATLDLDVGVFQRVLDNLLTNAVKYTPSGEVEVELTVDRDSLIARVRDTGRGIEPALLARIFQYGASDPARRAPRSYGVGLAGVARLLREYGGRIEAASEVNVGTTFLVHFPIGDPSAGRMAGPAQRPQ